ncbi:MAG: N-acyl homoserine lactonase family protein [Chrysiogenetes bacterium]|nr:N-acyl homoserine lactonase family protein [Chrysiogenetes bacterium]
MTQARRLYVLLCGYEVLPKTVSTKGRGARFIMAEPICAYLIQTTSGYVLFDAGFNTYNTEDPIRRGQFFERWGMIPPVVLPEHQMLYQLDQIGVKPEQIGDVVISHSHFDHTGNLKYLRHARITMQKREYEYAMHEATPKNAVIKSDFDFPDLNWNLIDGDFEIAEGVEVIYTRGHMPGHQSMAVRLPKSGMKVMPADAGDLMENYDEEILPGQTVDDDSARAAIRRLKGIVDSTHGEFLLTHDPVLIQTTKLAPEYYE